MPEQKSSTEAAVKGAHSQTAVVAIRGVLSLLYFSVMSRLLTPDDFGYFALISAVTTILGSLSEAGLGSSVVQKKDVSKEYIDTAYSLSIILGLAFGCILFLGAELFSKIVCGSNHLRLAFRLMSVILLSQSFNNILWAIYMRKLNFFRYGLIQIFAEFLSYILGIVLAFYGFGFYAIIAVAIFSQLFLTLTFVILGKVKFKFLIVKKYIKDIMGYGGWLTASVVVRNFTNEIDKIIIGRFLSISDLGAINRPSGFVGRINSHVNGIFDVVLFPILSGIQDNIEKITRAYIKIVSLMMTFSIILAGTLTISSKLIINIFFGPQWLDLQPILVIFSLATLIHGFSRVADSFFRSLGIVKLYFIARIINWVIFVGCVCIGCQFEIIGAAVGMVVGSILSCFIKFLMQRKYVNVNSVVLLKSILANISTPLLLFISIFLIDTYLGISEYIGITMFFTLLLVTMIFTPRLFGTVFRETVINRYLKRFQIMRIY